MNDKIKTCIVCEKSSDQVPLIKFKFKGEKYYICSIDFPVMIHKQHQLVGKLPGAESLLEE